MLRFEGPVEAALHCRIALYRIFKHTKAASQSCIPVIDVLRRLS